MVYISLSSSFPAFQDINAYNGEEPTEKLPFPIIDDKNRDLAILLGMLDPAEKDEKGMPVTARVVSLSLRSVVVTSKCLNHPEEIRRLSPIRG